MSSLHPTMLLRNGQVVTPAGIHPTDVAVAEERIVSIGRNIAGSFDIVKDLEGRFLFPGVIDAHVHFNDPGRTDWEGLATGSRALAAGGGAVFFDMPLNSEPPVLDAAALREKRALAEAQACADFALWGGLVAGNEDRLEEMRDAGAIGFKAFLCDSGIASFPSIDGEALRAGMAAAARLDLPVAVHAEDQDLAARLTAEARARGGQGVRDYLASRPVQVETAAIARALEYAGETGCRLHVVHVSSPEGLELIARAKDGGVDVTAETCPHYLLLTEDDMARLGARAKCAPPLRDEGRRLGLWDALWNDQVDTIGSDHSPAPPALKGGADFFSVWGGIAGIQHGAALVLSATAASRNEHWPKLAAVLSENVARRFRLPAAKGSIAEGGDADFSIVSLLDPPEPIRAEDLVNRHPLSPYVGRACAVRIAETYIRGRPAASQRGQFLRPE